MDRREIARDIGLRALVTRDGAIQLRTARGLLLKKEAGTAEVREGKPGLRPIISELGALRFIVDLNEQGPGAHEGAGMEVDRGDDAGKLGGQRHALRGRETADAADVVAPLGLFHARSRYRNDRHATRHHECMDLVIDECLPAEDSREDEREDEGDQNHAFFHRDSFCDRAVETGLATFGADVPL